MKFNQIHHPILVVLISLLCYNKVIYGDNSEAKKWHIIAGRLHYIEVEQKYNTNDAFKFCNSIGMINYIGDINAEEFGKYFNSFKGHVPSLWSANFHKCQFEETRLLLRRETNNETKFVYEICTAKFGFICSTNILHGEIRFKNGTQLFANRDDVIKYCDPQAEYDFDQKNCMITFERILL